MKPSCSTEVAALGRRQSPALLACALFSTALAAAAPARAQALDGTDVDTALLRRSMGAPLGVPLEGEALEKRTHEVAELIRCPVCQGSSVADSPATMAQNMKAEVRELLAAGYDEEQILHSFELAYGEFIRMKPKADGFKALLWVMPALVLVGGFGAVGMATRRRRHSAAADPARNDDPREPAPPSRGEVPADPALAACVRRVREMAYGWPGGEPPAGRA